MTEMPRKRKFLSGVQKLTARFLCHEKQQFPPSCLPPSCLPPSCRSTQGSCSVNNPYDQRHNPVFTQSIDTRCADPVYAQCADLTSKYDDVDKTVEPVYWSVSSVDPSKACSRWLEDSTQRGRVSNNHTNTSGRVGANRRRLEKDKGHSSESKVSCAYTELTRCRYMHRSLKMSELKAVDTEVRNLHSADSGFTDDLLSTTFSQEETITEGRFILILSSVA